MLEVGKMSTKKLIVLAVCASVIAGCGFLFLKKEEPQVEEEAVAVKPIAEPKPLKVVDNTPPKIEKYDLYSSTVYDLPLSSITEITKLTPEAKKSVDELFDEAQGFYTLWYDAEDKKAVILLQNPVKETNYVRHGLEFAQVMPNGEKKFYSAGFTGPEDENDEWEFDKTVEHKRPIKHVKYNEKGKVDFVEVWDYSPEASIKYEMKDADGKPVSILKETVDGTTYRKEHIFYDNSGNTKMNISASYNGAELERFTYFNSDDEKNSKVIISEFSDGVKVGENIYNKDYELQKILKSEYENGERKKIKVFDADNKEVGQYQSF